MEEEGFTYCSYLIVRGEFKFESIRLGAELFEFDRSMCRILPFLEDKVCAEKTCTCWPYRRGLVASPIT